MNNFQKKIIENDISSNNSFQLFKLWKHINIKEKIPVIFNFICNDSECGFAEVISLASIMPFSICDFN